MQSIISQGEADVESPRLYSCLVARDRGRRRGARTATSSGAAVFLAHLHPGTSQQNSPASYNFGVQYLTCLTSYTLHRHHNVPIRTNPLEYFVFVSLKNRLRGTY